MRRSSLVPMSSQGSCQEPLIVVEELGNQENEEHENNSSSPKGSLDIDSPQNPYLLSPWRDPRETRKHSLPTPACTSGITASQVRRLSERGGEGSGPSPREAAFLATLCSAPVPQPGGRRHSVVTISRVPPAMFGRNRRESVAALPSFRSPQGGPPTTDRRGSAHNLQLDIMDDIVSARKVRMKLWNTSSERVCEVQPLDETEAASSCPQRYTKPGRRHSDFMPPPIPPTRRRASEQPPTRKVEGIVCTDNDLISILTSLTSSATEINRCGEAPPPKVTEIQSADSKRSKMKNNRSNSFDASVLHGVNINKPEENNEQVSVSPSSWFIKRHQTLAKKKDDTGNKPPVTQFKEFRSNSLRSPNIPKVVWDKPTGSVVDAQVLGSAIEVFLRQTGGSTEPAAPPTTQQPPNGNKVQKPGPSLKGKSPTGTSTKGAWYPNKPDEEEPAENCDSSLCSTLKDLFVK